MKRKTLLLLAVIAVAIAFYLSTPKHFVVSKSINIHANSDGVFRYLSIDSNWQRLWAAGRGNKDGREVMPDGYRFVLKEILYNAFRFNIIGDGMDINSTIYLVPVSVDSMQAKWVSTIDAGINPITKIKRYLLSKRLEKTFDEIAGSMEAYLSKPKNIYGLNITNEKVTIQNVISTKRTFTHSPQTADIYAMIREVRKYIEEAGGKEQGQPMLNIVTNDSSHFNAQVAIPVDRILAENKIFLTKWFMKGGNILVSEVSGGEHTINQGFKSMERYISDYRRNIIAIPFQTLVTDRTKETDSTKWLTRLYYPVM